MILDYFLVTVLVISTIFMSFEGNFDQFVLGVDSPFLIETLDTFLEIFNVVF